MYSRLSLLTATFLWLSHNHAVSARWNESVTVDLAWPPVGIQGDVTSRPDRDSLPYGVFPCEAETEALNGPRVDFPITGGCLQYNLVNSTGQLVGQQFLSNSYFGQMSIDVSADQSGWAGISVDTYDNFETGHQCSTPLNVSYLLQDHPYFRSKVGTSVEALVGANVTLGVYIWYWMPDGKTVAGEIYQCSYLRLVAENAEVTQDRGPCNTETSQTPSTTASATEANANPTSSDRSTTTSSSSTVSESANNSLYHSIIGITVGVTIPLLIVVSIACCALFRRIRKPKPTAALNLRATSLPQPVNEQLESTGTDIGSAEKEKPVVEVDIAAIGQTSSVKTKQKTCKSEQRQSMAQKKELELNSDDDSTSIRDSVRTGSVTETLPPYDEEAKRVA